MYVSCLHITAHGFSGMVYKKLFDKSTVLKAGIPLKKSGGNTDKEFQLQEVLNDYVKRKTNF